MQFRAIHRIGIINVIVLITLSFHAFAVSDERLLRFAADESIGEIYIQVNEPKYVHPYNPFHDLAQWELFAPALGTVKIPANKRVKLVITAAIGDHPEKLESLKQFKPGDLYALQLAPGWSGPKPATDQCIPYIRHLTGLKHLNLLDSAITRSGLEQLLEMKQMERIVLPKNLTNGGLGTVSKMTSLKSMRFKESKITDRAMVLLTRLPHLKELYLFGCGNLTDSGLAHLPELTRLEYLYLGTSQQPFSSQGFTYVAQVPNMRTLWIDTGNCTDEKLQPFCRHPTLETLSLHWESHITDRGISYVAAIPNLKLLDINSARELSDRSLDWICQMTQLEYLNLPSVYTDSGVAKLAPLENLRYLSVNPSSKSPLTDASLHVFSRFPNLEKLMTGGTGFTDEGIRELTNLKNMKKLLISTAPKVTNEGFGSLSSIENLEELTWRINGQKITFAGVNKFGNHKSLKKLFLWGVPKGRSVLNISGMDDLEYLQIDTLLQFENEKQTSPTVNNTFTDEDLTCLADLKKLQYLQLRGNGYGDEGLKHLSGLHNLRTLFLNGQTLITDAGLTYLTDLDQLWQLHIHDGHFTDDALDTLSRLQALTILELTSDTAFSATAAAKFKSEMKNLKKLKLNVVGTTSRMNQDIDHRRNALLLSKRSSAEELKNIRQLLDQMED